MLRDRRWIFLVYQCCSVLGCRRLRDAKGGATNVCVKDVHPDGAADTASGELYNAHLRTVRPDYVGVVKSSSGSTIWGRQVTYGKDLEIALKEAADFVLGEKRGAMLEVLRSSVTCCGTSASSIGMESIC